MMIGSISQILHPLCLRNLGLLERLGSFISRLYVAHCLPCKRSQITATFKPHEGENSSGIMILLHARGFLRSVLSTGSQHFLYMTQGGSYIQTGNYIFFELGGGGGGGVKINNPKNMMQTTLAPLVFWCLLFCYRCSSLW